MSWRTCHPMNQREDCILLAKLPGANVSELCRRFGVSRKTGNKWLARYRQGGAEALLDRSRRPKGCLALRQAGGGERCARPA